ncbi:hypothetical protein K443DRAFT_124183 [Laccaria amethystina LaAM-08-1]|uniref:Uncharacterized protein n=1 Tax=Laccaria amethystina LaAM-08-1 TaxID=1095629 RepID=A0A0C9WL97_9AGAR|nr:hypothetical protein K443DRAFT_124183 [Laccaria amethystina LaAM-08-1]
MAGEGTRLRLCVRSPIPSELLRYKCLRCASAREESPFDPRLVRSVKIVIDGSHLDLLHAREKGCYPSRTKSQGKRRMSNSGISTCINEWKMEEDELVWLMLRGMEKKVLRKFSRRAIDDRFLSGIPPSTSRGGRQPFPLFFRELSPVRNACDKDDRRLYLP